MKNETVQCPACKRRYRLDLDGAIAPHNIKGKKENTLANLCKGSHRLTGKKS